MEGLRVFPHACGPFRHGRVENVGIGPARPQEATGTVAMLDDAHGFLEGMAEGAAEGRPFKRWQIKRRSRFEDKAERQE